MTAQVSDKIKIDGEWYKLFTNPLDDYWDKRNPKPKIGLPNTSCWRGYIASWELLDSCLYLIDIEFFTPNGEVGLDYLFPKTPEKVKAVWYTGKLRIPLGDRIRYVHGGYESVYEKDLIIRIRKGKYRWQKLMSNY